MLKHNDGNIHSNAYNSLRRYSRDTIFCLIRQLLLPNKKERDNRIYFIALFNHWIHLGYFI